MAYSTPKEVAIAKMELDNAAFKLRQAIRQMKQTGPGKVSKESIDELEALERRLMAIVDDLGAYV